MIKRLALKSLKIYQLFISGILGRNCRFYPSCSEYTYEAIEKYGIFKGFCQGTKRIFKCHPFNKGGVDLP